MLDADAMPYVADVTSARRGDRARSKSTKATAAESSVACTMSRLAQAGRAAPAAVAPTLARSFVRATSETTTKYAA